MGVVVVEMCLMFDRNEIFPLLLVNKDIDLQIQSFNLAAADQRLIHKYLYQTYKLGKAIKNLYKCEHRSIINGVLFSI